MAVKVEELEVFEEDAAPSTARILEALEALGSSVRQMSDEDLEHAYLVMQEFTARVNAALLRCQQQQP